ncbi:MAG TPA: hypothetical protein VGM10_19185 [Actinocrinis sp.]
MSEDLDEAAGTRVRELMRRAADEYRPAVDLVSGVAGEARRVRRNRKIGVGVGSAAAVFSAAAVILFSVILPAGPGHTPQTVGPATSPTQSPSPTPSTPPVDSTISSSVGVTSEPAATLPGTWISPPGATYGLPWEVSIDSGAVSNPCIYLLLPINRSSQVECVMHYLPDLSAAGTSAGDGLLADSMYLLIGNYSPFPPEDDCGLVLVVFATQNVAQIDITGIVDNNYGLDVYPKDTGEPDAYAAAVVNVGAQFTFTSMDGSTSSAQTISAQETCPPSSI